MCRCRAVVLRKRSRLRCRVGVERQRCHGGCEGDLRGCCPSLGVGSRFCEDAILGERDRVPDQIAGLIVCGRVTVDQGLAGNTRPLCSLAADRGLTIHVWWQGRRCVVVGKVTSAESVGHRRSNAVHGVKSAIDATRLTRT